MTEFYCLVSIMKAEKERGIRKIKVCELWFTSCQMSCREGTCSADI